jgi:hypothetical protein
MLLRLRRRWQAARRERSTRRSSSRNARRAERLYGEGTRTMSDEGRGAGRFPAKDRSRARRSSRRPRGACSGAPAAAEIVEVGERDAGGGWPARCGRGDRRHAVHWRLGNCVAQVLGRDPRHARAIAELAVSIAGLPKRPTLPRSSHNRAHAWKDLGKALYLGSSLTRSGRRGRQTHASRHSIAGARPRDVALVRAETLQQIDRFSEASTRCRANVCSGSW